MPLEDWGGGLFHWQTPERPEPDGMTVWNGVMDPEGNRLELWQPPKS